MVFIPGMCITWPMQQLAHTRHIIEMLDCVLKGYETGQIDYTNRIRNLQLETNQPLAIIKAGLIELRSAALIPPPQLYRIGYRHV